MIWAKEDSRMAKDDRLRVQVDHEYLSALGMAVYCFARLEWNAVYVAHRIGANGHNSSASPNYLTILKKKTAGTIAKDLNRFASGIKDISIKQQVEPVASRFNKLTERRYALMNANPGTAPNGDQRLFRHGDEWTIAETNALSDEFTARAEELNQLIHQVL